MTDIPLAPGPVFDATAAAPPRDNGAATPLDALDHLREQLAERDATKQANRLVSVDIPEVGWRLLCATDFDFAQYQEWQRASLRRKPGARRSRNPVDVMMSLDQAMLATFVLTNTCEEVEYQVGSGEWKPLVDGQGEPLTLTDGALLTRFNMVDPRTFVRMLFGGDPELIRASEKVARAAGWIDDDDFEEGPDPTA